MAREITKTETKYRGAYQRLESLKKAIESATSLSMSGITSSFGMVEGPGARDEVEMTFVIRNAYSGTPRVILRRTETCKPAEAEVTATRIAEMVLSDIVRAGVAKMSADTFKFTGMPGTGEENESQELELEKGTYAL